MGRTYRICVRLSFIMRMRLPAGLMQVPRRSTEPNAHHQRRATSRTKDMRFT